MTTEDRIDGLEPVETDSLVDILKRFREGIESDGETKLHQVVVPCALFLSDICDAFGLSKDQHDEVLGDNVEYIEEWQHTYVIPTNMAALPAEELAATAG